jgi:hypothetical protein
MAEGPEALLPPPWCEAVIAVGTCTAGCSSLGEGGP